MYKKIAIIGAGHLGQALARGFLRSEVFSSENLIIASPHPEKLDSFKEIKVTGNNIEAVKESNVVILCVKPKVVREVVGQVKSFINKDKLIVSVAASVTFSLLEQYFERKDLRIFRIMPNIPVEYGLGIVGLTGNENVSPEDKDIIYALFAGLGLIVKCDTEEKLDKLSMISGCGPGYLSYIISLLEGITREYGFGEEASQIVTQTIVGTIKQLEMKNIKAEELSAAVATPGGITEEVINTMKEKDLRSILSESLSRGYAKIEKVTEELKINN